MRGLLCCLLLAVPLYGSVANYYVAQAAGVFSGGTACNGQTAVTLATANGAGQWGAGVSQIGQDTTVWFCGTLTVSSGTTGLSIQNSGASGHPLTVKFDTGAILQSPVFAASGGQTNAGGIACGGNSWLVIDGNSLTGTIQNTANGSSLANQTSTAGIACFNGSNNIIKNLNVANIYVNVLGNSTIADSSIVRAIDFSGSNWTISGNVIHDCGWCITEFAGNDSNVTISNNDISNFSHGWAIAPQTGNAASSLFFSSNHLHGAANWGAPGCFAHIDGIHAFGNATSSIDQVFVSNNLFDGNWGTCPTGFIFVEGGGSSSAAHMKTSAWWNNVMIVDAGNPTNLTQGWFGLFAGDSGTQTVVNNTIIGNNGTDNTACYVMTGETSLPMSALTFENNVAAPCGNPITIGTASFNVTITSVNNNFYGAFGFNAFSLRGATETTFAAWKTACSCDGNAVQNNTSKLNADGSPQVGSPVISAALNLSGLATGSLTSLQNDTTNGSTRVVIARPPVAAWDIGAFQYQAATPTSGAVISGLIVGSAVIH